ncbi:MAG: hypothetical protein IPL32_12620 [Chloracidobacterium sp.]|nr:hypothetical protein [Chloracidobacterium sp.]
MRISSILGTVLVICFCAQIFVGQSTEVDKGIELVKKKDYVSAILLFNQIVKREETNAKAWFYLAKSYEALGKEGDAGRSYYKAFDTGYEVFRENFNKQFETKNTKVESLLEVVKSQSDVVSICINSAGKATQYNTKLSYDNEPRLKTNSLYQLSKIAESGEALFWNKDTDNRVKFVKSTYVSDGFDTYPPQRGLVVYPKTVKLLLVIDSNGKVVVAMPIAKPQSWFDLQAMRRVLEYQWEPAQNNGKTVLTLMRFDYRFSQ